MSSANEFPPTNSKIVVSQFPNRDSATSFAKLIEEQIDVSSRAKSNGKTGKRNSDYEGFGYLVNSDRQGYSSSGLPPEHSVAFSIPDTLDSSEVIRRIQLYAKAFGNERGLENLSVVCSPVKPTSQSRGMATN